MTLQNLFVYCDTFDDDTVFVVFDTWVEYKMVMAPIASSTFDELPWEIATGDLRKFRIEGNTVYAWVEVDE